MFIVIVGSKGSRRWCWVECKGPLYIWDIYFKSKEMHEYYILLFTSAATSCVRLDLVSGFHTDTTRVSFLFQEEQNLSDNFKTFKSKEVKSILIKQRDQMGIYPREITLVRWFYERFLNIIKKLFQESHTKVISELERNKTLRTNTKFATVNEFRGDMKVLHNQVVPWLTEASVWKQGIWQKWIKKLMSEKLYWETVL